MGSRTKGSSRLRVALAAIHNAAYARREREERQAARKRKKIPEWAGPFHALALRLGMPQRRIEEIMDGVSPSKSELSALQSVLH